MAYRLLIVAASMPVASAFAATGSHLISLKPALQASMLLPDPAISADVASIDLAPMTLLAMSKADAALADAFGAIFPLGTLATAAVRCDESCEPPVAHSSAHD